MKLDKNIEEQAAEYKSNKSKLKEIIRDNEENESKYKSLKKQLKKGSASLEVDIPLKKIEKSLKSNLENIKEQQEKDLKTM